MKTDNIKYFKWITNDGDTEYYRVFSDDTWEWNYEGGGWHKPFNNEINSKWSSFYKKWKNNQEFSEITEADLFAILL